MASRPGKGDNRKAGGCSLIIFFGIFFLIGSGFTVFMLLEFYREIEVGQSWTEAEAVILDERIKVTRGDESDSYEPFIKFRYEFEGRTFEREGYKRTSIMKTRAGANKALNRFNPGDTATCWINPKNPYEAVLAHGLGWEVLMVFIPLLFVAIGVGGIFGGIKKATSANHRRPTGKLPDIFPDLKTKRGRQLGVSLRPKASALTEFIGLLIVALFWNGITWGVLIAIWRDNDGVFSIVGTVFLSIFCLIGLGLLGAAGKKLLFVLLTGDAAMEIEREPLRSGESVEFAILHPMKHRPDHVEAKLICREKASYQQGTDTITREEVVHSELVLDVPADRLPSGRQLNLRGRMSIPADAMHSFKDQHNEITWGVQVKMEIPNRPDVDEFYPFRVGN